ncbi:MAG: thioredoxin domain-containing protein [Desulfobacca sp.]|uniref:thioredoxin domain-containing protein n=1 Tax=Desulfobacca sp. TaxID=2067990 RepID=UPI00404B3BC0
MTDHGQPNRLIQEASPYLQQHAYNPVDWYPWGPEALARARQEDRPILLSIGYSTCHWCHVMAHECFENPDIARLMNDLFVNIKVDREERPDLDDVYMNAVQMLTGRGGWPLTVFLTPDLKPFYGGTYFPPEDRGGLPGFPRLLQALAAAYRDKKDNIANVAGLLDQNLQILALTPAPGPAPDLANLDQTLSQALTHFDKENGGFAGAPKFPPSLDLGFWARSYYRTGNGEILENFLFTLQKMALGGIYDQLRGGFHRYTVDGIWLIPHFEKMLYDNAQLTQRYLEAYQLTGDPWYATIARETLDYILAEMTSPDGPFYAAQDADSEGVEGKFFVWTPAEISQVVGPDRAPLIQAAFGVTAAGNFEHGASVLHRPLRETELAQQFSLSVDQVREILMQARRQLLAAREQRVRPHRDEKIITAWNGLMISAMATGGQVLAEARYTQAAVRAAAFLLDQEEQQGRLQRTWGPTTSGPRPAFLDDYAYFIAGLLDVYESDFDLRWLRAARRLTQETERDFYDQKAGGYFSTPEDHERLLVRPKNFLDLAVPSGNSVMVHNLIRLHRVTERSEFWARAQEILTRLQTLLLENPRALSNLAAAQEGFLASPLAITLVGEPDQPVIREMLAEIYRRFLPHRRLVLKTPANAAELAQLVPASRDYEQIGGQPTAFVCPGTTCLAPVHSAAALAALLDRQGRREMRG